MHTEIYGFPYFHRDDRVGAFVCWGIVLWTKRSKVHSYAHLSRAKDVAKENANVPISSIKETALAKFACKRKWLKSNINYLLRKRKDKLLRFRNISESSREQRISNTAFYLFFMPFDVCSLWNETLHADLHGMMILETFVQVHVTRSIE